MLTRVSSSVADTTALAPRADLTAATFDGSAAYLAVGGAQVQIYNIVKGKFPELAQLSDTQKVGTASLICFIEDLMHPTRILPAACNCTCCSSA